MLVDEVIAALSSSIGEEKARAAVEDTCDSMGVERRTMTRDDALAVLESIADTPGVVGVCARFSRSRFILQWASHDLSNAFGGPRASSKR